MGGATDSGVDFLDSNPSSSISQLCDLELNELHVPQFHCKMKSILAFYQAINNFKGKKVT